MTIRCSVCKSEPARLGAINAALAAGVPLDEISRSSGITKSSLHRHAKHIPGGEMNTAVTSGRPSAPVPAPRGPLTPPLAPKPRPRPAAPTKEELLERIELLWGESLEGLEAAKEPIRVTKPDGSSLELPGDLRSRAAFIREARSVVELSAAVSGELNAPATSGATFVLIPIAIPMPSLAPLLSQPPAQDVEWTEVPNQGGGPS